MRHALFLLILFVFVGCNSKEAQLGSIQGIRDPNNPLPKIVSVLPQGPGTYSVGSGLDFYVTYDDVVLVDGSPRLAIIADSGTYFANYISGSGTNILYFQFIVPAGAFDYNGIQLSGVMNLNGGSIYDPDDDDDSQLGYSIPSTTAVLINGIDPVITSITIDNGNYKIGDTLEFTVNYSFPVHVTGTPSLPIKVGAASLPANYVSGSGTSALKFTYAVTALQDYNGVDTNVGSISLVGASIKDYFGDNAGAIFATANFPSVIVDGITPEENARSAPLNGATKFEGSLLIYMVNYSEIVNVTGAPRIQVIIGSTTRYANYYDGSGTSSISFSYSVAAGELDTNGIVEVTAVDLNGGTIKDRVGNPISNTFLPWPAHTTYVDAVSPTVAGTGFTSSNYKIADFIEPIVTFSENVTITGSPILSINVGGTTKQATYLSGTGTSTLRFRYIVEEGALDTDGISSVSPLILNGGTIKDATGNNAVLTFTSGTNLTARVDGIRPTLSLTTTPTAAPTAIWRPGSTLSFTVTASENITVNGGTPSIHLSIGANSRAASLFSSSGSSMVFNYNVVAADMDLDGISLNSSNVILNGANLQDSFGNNAVLSLAAVDMSKVFVLPNEIKYWFDANDPLTTTGTTSATSFNSKADSIFPSLTGAPPALVAGPNGTKFAQFTGANNFTLTMSDADVVITTVKIPNANGSAWRSLDSTKRIHFDYFLTFNTVYTGSYCNAWCFFYKPVGSMPMVTVSNALDPYSFSPNEYRTIAVDYRSPGAGISYKMGDFNGQIGEIIILSSAGAISTSLIQAIGDYLNTKHGAAW
jgi:hypothetical protein